MQHLRHRFDELHVSPCRSWRGQWRFPMQWQQQHNLSTSQPYPLHSNCLHWHCVCMLFNKHTSSISHLVSCRSWREHCRLPRQWQQQRKLCTSQPFSFESQRSHIWVSSARGGMLRDDSIRIPETARIVGVRLVGMLWLEVRAVGR